MDQAIQDGIGQRGVSDPPVPFGTRDLGGDDRGVEVVAVLQDLEQILTLFRRDGGQAEVLQDQDVLAGKHLEEGQEFSGAPGNLERLEEPGEADEKDIVAKTAGLVAQGFGHIAFADPGGTGDEHVLVVDDPLAGEKRLDQRLGKVPGTPEVEVLGGGVLSKLGGHESARRPPVLLNRHFAVDQKTQPVFERKIGPKGRGRFLFGQGLEEAGELERLELLLERVDQHGSFSLSGWSGRRQRPPPAVFSFVS